jgi:NADPH2:quinone reductase
VVIRPGTPQQCALTRANSASAVSTPWSESGALATYGYTYGHILGNEIAGTVAAIGEGVEPAWVGQRVWAFTGVGGGYAEHVIAPAAKLIPPPGGPSAVDAVTLGSSGRVTHFALRHAPLRTRRVGVGARRGRRHRHHGGPARGSRRCRCRGGTTSSAERGDLLRKLGADLPSFFARLNPNCRMVAVGAVAGHPPVDFGMEMVTAFQKSMSFATFSADTVPAPDQHAATAESHN